MRRITELEIENFRVYRGKRTISLDADTVLIYGPNGSGKTALFSALEFAVTGEVGNLKTLTEDYPRCLKNVDSKEPARVTINFKRDNEKLHKCTRYIDPKKDKSNKTPVFNQVERRFFLERCYLSQSFLIHALDAYQDSGSNGSEQPILEFVRKLLNLDILDNLTSGLHIIGDVRRIEKTDKTVSILERKKEEFSGKIKNIKEQISCQKEKVCQLRTVAQDKAGSIPLPIGSIPLTTKISLNEKRQTIEKRQELQQRDLKNIQELRTRVDEVLKGLDVSETDSILQNWATYVKFLMIRRRKRKVRDSLINVAKEIYKKLYDLDLDYKDLLIQEIHKKQDIGDELGELEIALSTSLDSYNRSAIEIKNLKHDLQTDKKKLNNIDKNIKDLGKLSANATKSHERLCSALLIISDHIKGNRCPTCDRDYSEVGKKSLKLHVDNKINQLNVDIEKIKNDLDKYGKLKTERDQITKNIELKRAALEKKQPPLVETKQKQLLEIVNSIKAVGKTRELWSWLFTNEAQLRRRLKQFKTKKIAIKSNRREILNASQQLGIDPKDFPKTTDKLKVMLEHAFENKLNEHECKTNVLKELLCTLESIEEGKTLLGQFAMQYATLKRKEIQAYEALKKVKDQLNITRKLAKAAHTTKVKLLNEVFNQRLNNLWVDIFQRLAKFQRFKPIFAEPELCRNRMRTKIQGVAQDIKPFTLKAIQSTGNINTAALSLFIAMHLIEKPQHTVLLLDDPIQNMDDVHCLNLACLLRNLVYDLKRQVIIAVHERAMFDYLCMELGPRNDKQNLIAIELKRDTKTYTTDIVRKKIQWTPDNLKLSG